MAAELTRQLVGIVRSLRELDLRKPPSIAETVDWARTLAVLGADELRADVLADTLSVVVKYERDVVRAADALPGLVTLALRGPGAGPQHRHADHRHPHDQPHDHAQDHAHEHPHDHPHPNRTDEGRAARLAKDRPGRFDRGYYGTPDLSALG